VRIRTPVKIFQIFAQGFYRSQTAKMGTFKGVFVIIKVTAQMAQF